MADPFDDMADLNPFADPSVASAAQSTSKTQTAQEIKPSYAAQESYNVVRPKESAPDNFSAYPSNLTAELEEFKKREDELRRREAELSRREATLNSSPYKPPNFPPFPSWIPIQPCFYINIEEEIPTQCITLCKKLYLKLIVYSILLLLNVLGMIFILSSGIKGSTVPFVMSIIAFVFVIPLSFLFCFRAGYVALKTKSSFNYIVFFTSYTIEIVMHAVQLFGIIGSPWCGFINGAFMLDENHAFGGVYCIIMGLFWIGLLLFSMLLTKKMHNSYKLVGGNMAQAQNEFTAGVWKTGGNAMVNNYFGENTNIP